MADTVVEVSLHGGGFVSVAGDDPLECRPIDVLLEDGTALPRVGLLVAGVEYVTRFTSVEGLVAAVGGKAALSRRRALEAEAARAAELARIAWEREHADPDTDPDTDPDADTDTDADTDPVAG